MYPYPSVLSDVHVSIHFPFSLVLVSARTVLDLRARHFLFPCECSGLYGTSTYMLVLEFGIY
jgi:hypothetical protein